MLINENEMLLILKESKSVLLLEPIFSRRAYLPLGLAKISTYVKNHGGDVIFKQAFDGNEYDCICISTLFTYDSKNIFNVIKEIRIFHPKVKIIIGGIFASLMTDYILKNIPNDVMIFKGCSKQLDMCVPDYNIDWKIKKEKTKYSFNDFSFLFSSRGCPNKCAYCAVWRIEKEKWINPNWKKHIMDNKLYVALLDNNISYFSNKYLENIVDFLNEKNKTVLMDGGIDCKYITKAKAKIYAKINFVDNGLRIAFDRIEEDGIFQNAIQMLLDNGVKRKSIMVYTLYNFNDTPREMVYRVNQIKKFGVDIYPQKYKPLNLLTHNFPISKNWTGNLAKLIFIWGRLSGYHNRMSFEDFLKDRESLIKTIGGKDKSRKWERIDKKNPGFFCIEREIIKLTAEDWEKWNIDKNKWIS